MVVTAGTTAGLRHLLAVLPREPGRRGGPRLPRRRRSPCEESGRAVVDLPALAPVTDLAGACAAYVTPAHQHPLGRVMPAEDRLTLLATARRDGAVVLEDDYDSEFRYDVAPVPALASLEPDLVAYLGTASKSVAPSLRLGWLVAPPHLRPDLDRHRRITHDAPAWPVQRAFWALLRDGYVDAVVRSARRTYAERAPRVVAALSPYAELAGPVAGMYSTWLLPHDRAVRARQAAEAAGFRVNLLADYARSVRPHRAGRRLRRSDRRAARRGAGRAGPLAGRVTIAAAERQSGFSARYAAQASARSRSILRPRKSAMPHSRAKMPPRTNIIGTRKPIAIAPTCSTQPSGVGPGGAEHAGEQQAGDRQADADEQRPARPARRRW